MRTKLGFLLLLIFLLAGCNSLNSSTGTTSSTTSTSSTTTTTTSTSTTTSTTTTTLYPLHENINSTVFWVGEEASEDNGWIANDNSAWDDYWVEGFGGIDDPDNRNGYYPTSFTPNENPFYYALPYNDYDEGVRKSDVNQVIYWVNDKSWGTWESMCKNQWAKIIFGTRECYAQWQDTGPYLDDDSDYVFGSTDPANTVGTSAGIDLSPAVGDYLGHDGTEVVSWQFVASTEVPSGPWSDIVTNQQIDWW